MFFEKMRCNMPTIICELECLQRKCDVIVRLSAGIDAKRKNAHG